MTTWCQPLLPGMGSQIAEDLDFKLLVINPSSVGNKNTFIPIGELPNQPLPRPGQKCLLKSCLEAARIKSSLCRVGGLCYSGSHAHHYLFILFLFYSAYMLSWTIALGYL